jgi:hypothetical protein
MDELSALLRNILKIFGTTHPIRVGVGICGGLAAKVIWAVALAYFPASPLFRVLNDFPAYYDCLVFVGILMLPTAFGYKGAPEAVAHQIRTVEALLDAAGFSAAQRRLVWHSLVQKYLGVLEPDLRSRKKIELVDEAKEAIASASSESREAD